VGLGLGRQPRHVHLSAEFSLFHKRRPPSATLRDPISAFRLCVGSPATGGGHGLGKGSPTWFSELSEDMRSASTGLMLLDDIDETEEVCGG